MAWSTHVRDAIECVLVPATIALLPFRAGLAVARVVARIPWLYRQYTAGFAEGAARLGVAPDPEALLRRRRLYVLLDHVDLYWNRFRDPAWVLRNVQIEGRWPAGEKPFVAVFYHWGYGLTAMRHLSATSHVARLVGRPIAEAQLAARPWQLRYARMRYAAAASAGAGPVIFWGGAKARIREALRTPATAVLGAVDVPPTETHSLTPVRLLGRQTSFTHGLVDLAIEAGVPVVTFRMGLSPDGRRQILRIDAPIDAGGIDRGQLMQRLAERLDALIAQDAAAWSLWAWLDAFFPPDRSHDPAPAAEANRSSFPSDGASG